jgi:hypothetical protein
MLSILASIILSHKKEIEETNLGTDLAKKLELDEQPNLQEKLVILPSQYRIRKTQVHMAK